MTGETDLTKLLAGLDPVLDAVVWGFVSLPQTAPEPSDAILRYAEQEGVTYIAPWDALASDKRVFACRRITLKIHSALEAVGMMAAISQALTAAKISCNPVAGFYHDHLFVPTDQAHDALNVIQTLVAQHTSTT